MKAYFNINYYTNFLQFCQALIGARKKPADRTKSIGWLLYSVFILMLSSSDIFSVQDIMGLMPVWRA